jgi:hypothetical protein
MSRALSPHVRPERLEHDLLNFLSLTLALDDEKRRAKTRFVAVVLDHTNGCRIRTALRRALHRTGGRDPRHSQRYRLFHAEPKVAVDPVVC